MPQSQGGLEPIDDPKFESHLRVLQKKTIPDSVLKGFQILSACKTRQPKFEMTAVFRMFLQ